MAPNSADLRRQVKYWIEHEIRLGHSITGPLSGSTLDSDLFKPTGSTSPHHLSAF